jgi:N-acyl-D-aspartate/D-glutamate deacylase
LSRNDNLLVANGSLVSKDHSGGRGDVLVAGERIASVAPSIPARSGWKVIDAAGRIVAPVFMNIHSHADFHLPLPEHTKLYERRCVREKKTLDWQTVIGDSPTR